MRFSFPSPIISLFSVSSVRSRRRRRRLLFVAPFVSPRRSAKTKHTQRELAPSLERERESNARSRENKSERFLFLYYQGCLTGVFSRSGVVKKVARNSTFVVEQALLVWGLLL